MKKIEKEIQRVEKNVVYVANDGTEFSLESECRKYEESAKCVLMTKYNKLVVATKSEYEIFGVGREECVYDFVKLSSQGDCDVVMQAYFFYNQNETYRKTEECLLALGKALEEKDLMLIYRGFEEEHFLWFRTKSQILEEIAKNLSE